VTVSVEDDAVVWSHEGRLDGRMLVVLLHGYGQDEHAMAPVTEALQSSGDAVGEDGPGHALVTASLRGLRDSRAPLPGGRGWYDVDAEIQPEGGQENETAEAVLAWLDALPAERGTPAAIVVVGFSQGGALALHLLRHDPERFAAAVMLAGIWLSGTVGGDSRLADVHPRVFWGRSEHDFAIAPHLVARTEAALDGTVDLTHRVYPGDSHALLPEELADVAAYVSRGLAAHVD
jgi:phospholipase/carboxylesterase